MILKLNRTVGHLEALNNLTALYDSLIRVRYRNAFT